MLYSKVMLLELGLLDYMYCNLFYREDFKDVLERGNEFYIQADLLSV